MRLLKDHGWRSRLRERHMEHWFRWSSWKAEDFDSHMKRKTVRLNKLYDRRINNFAKDK